MVLLYAQVEPLSIPMKRVRKAYEYHRDMMTGYTELTVKDASKQAAKLMR